MNFSFNLTKHLRNLLCFCLVISSVVGCHSANNTTPFEKDSFDQSQDEQRRGGKPEDVMGPMDRMTWYLQEWQQVARAYNFGSNIKTTTETQGCVTFIPKNQYSMEIRMTNCRATDSENRIFVISGSEYVKRDEAGVITLTTSSSFELTNRSQLFLYWPQNGTREPFKIIRHVVIKPPSQSASQSSSNWDYHFYSELVSNSSTMKTTTADDDQTADAIPKVAEPKKNSPEHWILEAADSLIIESGTNIKIKGQSQLSVMDYRSTNRNTLVEGSAHLVAITDISVLDNCGKVDGGWGWDVLTKSGKSSEGKFLTEVGTGLILNQESSSQSKDVRSWPPCFGI